MNSSREDNEESSSLNNIKSSHSEEPIALQKDYFLIMSERLNSSK